MKESEKYSNEFELTWSKLENSMNLFTPQKTTVLKRPTTGRINKTRTISQDFHSTKPVTCKTSALNSSFSSFLKPQTTRNYFHAKSKSNSYEQASSPLLTSQIKSLYQAKCKDLGIIPFPEQEQRFFSYCSKHFHERNFEFMESGLGLNSAKAIAGILQNSKEFSFVRLGKNILGNAGCVEIVRGLYKNFSISHLDFSSNELTHVGLYEMVEFFKVNESIMSLDISSHKGLHRNRFGAKGAESVNKILKQRNILTFLNLEGTAIGDSGVIAMVEGISMAKSLLSLNLSGNNIGWEGVESLTKAVLYTNIVRLGLGNNKIGNEGADAICNMLMGYNINACPVETLDISCNEISTKGTNRIFYALTNNQTLKNLDLSNNFLEAGLPLNFTVFLIENSGLQSLGLSGCGIKSASLVMFPEAFPKNRTLAELDLSLNKIDDNGIEAICIGLSRNLGLKKLDLSSNYIKEKGGKSFANCFRVNSTLQELNLRENSINDEAGKELENLVRKNRNLLDINLDLNPIALKFVFNIKEALAKNKNIKTRKIVPELRQKIEQYSKNTDKIIKIQENISSKKREFADLNKRAEKTSERLEIIAIEEQKKNELVTQEYEEIKAQSYGVSQILDGIVFEISV